MINLRFPQQYSFTNLQIIKFKISKNYAKHIGKCQPIDYVIQKSYLKKRKTKPQHTNEKCTFSSLHIKLCKKSHH